MNAQKIHISSLVLANLLVKQFLDLEVSMQGLPKTSLSIAEVKEIGLSLINLLSEGDRNIMLERNDEAGIFVYFYGSIESDSRRMGVGFGQQEEEALLQNAISVEYTK